MTAELPEEIRAAKAGDPGALGSLFDRNLAPLIAFIRARVGAEIAARESVSDLAQSVCREVLEDLDDFEYRGESAFRNWLFQQAARKIVDRGRHLHRERRDVRREVPATAIGDEAMLGVYESICTPSVHAAARDELERIERVIQDLPEAQRDAVAMSRLMGLSYAEIAEIQNTTESAIRGLVARGLATLAAKLG